MSDPAPEPMNPKPILADKKVHLATPFLVVALAFLGGYFSYPWVPWRRATDPGSELKNEDAATIPRKWPHVSLVPDKMPYGYKQHYHFTQDWFTGNVPTWAVALKPYRDKPHVKYLEIGVWEGRSLLWVLDNIFTHPTSTVTGIDPFIDDPGWPTSKDIKGTTLANVKLSGEESRVNIITGFSQIELRKLPLDSYDAIYIDGSHTAGDTLEDMVLSWRLLKDGGLMIIDDYGLYLNVRDYIDRPMASVDMFYALFRNRFEVVHYGWQVMMRKKPSP